MMLVIDTAKAEAADREYGEQRQRLPDTDVMTKIWSLPRWRLWSRPTEFLKARFKNLDYCAQFVAVRPPDRRRCRSNIRGSARRRARVRVGRSRSRSYGAPASSTPLGPVPVRPVRDNRALDRFVQLGKRTHVLENLDVVTASLSSPPAWQTGREPESRRDHG